MKLFIMFLILSGNVTAAIHISENNINSFVESNPEVLNLRHRLEASQKLKGVLTRSFLPKVQLSYGHENYSTGPYNHVNQPFGGVEAKLNVYNSGKDSFESEKRNLEADVSGIDSTMVKAQVLAEIRKALAQLAFLDEASEILRSAIENNQSNMKAAQRRISAGLASETDNLDFRQQNIMLNQELSSLEYEKGVVKRLILTLFGHDPEQEVTVNYVNKHPEHGSEAVLKNPTGKSLLVKKALFQSDIAKIDMESAKRWWTPSVDLYGYALRFTQKEREYPTPGQRNDVTIGFRISMPIFDGGEGIRVAQSKKAISSAQESLARAKELEISKNSIDAMRRLDLTHDLIHGAEENVEVMTKYRKGILSEYDRGIKNSPDVLQANQRWIQAKNQHAEIKRNYQFARADALYLLGMFE